MYKISVLILLYNKEISDSETLNSILESKVNFPNSELVIWNNGPNALIDENLRKFENLGYAVSLKQTLKNEPLSLIYNTFLNERHSSKYIILDDDSTLNEKYISECVNVLSSQVGMPLISFGGDVVSPRVNEKKYHSDMVIKDSSKVTTIGSGIVIGGDIVSKLNEIYGRAFDERFYFYGVDKTFCLRLFESGLNDKIKIIPGFEHRLSRLESESYEVSEFRRLERSYDFALTLKYYNYRSVLGNIFMLLKLLLSTLEKIIKGKKPKYMFSHVIKAFILGKHYKLK